MASVRVGDADGQADRASAHGCRGEHRERLARRPLVAEPELGYAEPLGLLGGLNQIGRRARPGRARLAVAMSATGADYTAPDTDWRFRDSLFTRMAST